MKFQGDIFEAIFAFLLGAVVGSFLNVVIMRIPQGASVAHPPSTCPECGHSIRFFDNIPLFSFFLLGGQCRDCGSRISFRYPIVELISACLCTGLYFQFGLSLAFVLYLVFCSAMTAVFWIDLDHMIIPDVISLNGIAIGIVASLADLIPNMDWRLSLAGACLGALALYVPAFIYEKVRGLEGLGGGDIKLLAMIGAFTGPYGVIFVLFFSSLTGSVVALVGMLTKGSSSTTPIPFGPFLTSAAIFFVFFGKRIIYGVFGHSNLF